MRYKKLTPHILESTYTAFLKTIDVYIYKAREKCAKLRREIFRLD